MKLLIMMFFPNLLSSFWDQIFFSAPSSQTRTVYVLSAISKNKFHILRTTAKITVVYI
jgi:hypothetical protein